MEVNYTVTEDDYIKYNLFHHKNSPVSKRGIWIGRLFFPAIILFFTPIISDWRDPIFWIWPVVISLGWFFYYPILYRNTLAKNVRKLVSEGKQNGFTGTFKLTLLDEAIRYEGDGRLYETAYRHVERIARDQERLYIYTGSITAIIIPVAAFGDEAAAEAFLEELRRRTIFH